jgi:hypothetical protein
MRTTPWRSFKNSDIQNPPVAKFPAFTKQASQSVYTVVFSFFLFFSGNRCVVANLIETRFSLRQHSTKIVGDAPIYLKVSKNYLMDRWEAHIYTEHASVIIISHWLVKFCRQESTCNTTYEYVLVRSS